MRWAADHGEVAGRAGRELRLDVLHHARQPAAFVCFGVRVQGSGFRVDGGFSVLGSGFRVQGVGFDVLYHARQAAGGGGRFYMARKLD